MYDEVRRSRNFLLTTPWFVFRLYFSFTMLSPVSFKKRLHERAMPSIEAEKRF
jgi:hypothetical protein